MRAELRAVDARNALGGSRLREKRKLNVSVKSSSKRLGSSYTGLAWPMMWGSALWVGFYVLITKGVISHPLVVRYFAGHPVEYITSAMFFVGLAALVLKATSLRRQSSVLSAELLSDIPADGQPVAECDDLLEQLDEQPAAGRTYLGRRLRDAIIHVRQKGDAAGLDEHLKHLADLDAGRMQDGYSLVRMIIWATPMLGFLGTVIGITLAIGNLSPTELANNPSEAMKGLLAGLGVAFDTTALSLTLSIVLMFAQFLVSHLETHILFNVDNRADELLLGRFQQIGQSNDPHLVSVQRMSEAVVASSQELVAKQTELWQQTIDAAHAQWCQLTTSTGSQLQEALRGALSQSLAEHGERLAQSEETAAELSHLLWDRLQTTLRDNARLLEGQQQELTKQGETLLRIVEATGDVTRLEDTLNRNLDALAGARNFDEAVTSLSAAIQLLSARLHEARPAVELKPSSSKGRAA